MRWVVTAIAALLVLSGGLFFLQGMSLLPSRVMYGRPEWVVIGGAMVVIGIVLAFFTNWRAARTRR